MSDDQKILPHLLLAAFAQELARCGVEVIATSPGSRNTPLLYALNGQPELRCFPHIDERVAAFFALGAAKATGKPAAVVCTSGTAAANLHPAVLEADQAGVPLLVLTADRPAELREAGAGQTVDQLKLYGSAVRWFFELELPSEIEGAAFVREIACRACRIATRPKPGPVQINIPLRDPLFYNSPLPKPPGGRAGGMPHLRYLTPSPQPLSVPELERALAQSRRPLFVAGRLEGSREQLAEQGAQIAAAAARLGAPLFADPLSWSRRPPAAVAHYDALLRAEERLADLRPDLVVRIGALPTSKPLRSWLGKLGDAAQIGIHPWGELHDPERNLQLLVEAEPAAVLAAIAGSAADPQWLERWLALDRLAAATLDDLVGKRFGELAAIRRLADLVPEEADLVVASSLPIRDLELLWPALERSPRVLANRGANGIDGTVATALGVAAAQQRPTVLLVGDVTLAHDLGGIFSLGRLPVPLAIVAIDNEGGAIFDLLPVSQSPPAASFYTSQILTPPGIDHGRLAQAAGIAHLAPTDFAELAQGLRSVLAAQEPTLISLRFARAEGVAVRKGVAAAVDQTLFSESNAVSGGSRGPIGR